MPQDHPLASTQPLKEHYPIVVVGSGYGGGIAASRLARAGQEVCLLERGREIRPGDYPNTITEAGAEFQGNLKGHRVGNDQGLFDFLFGDDINVLVGCGLGGTSLINANVSIEPLDKVWQQSDRWPQQIQDDLETRVKKGLERAREMLRPKPYPLNGETLFKLKALEKQADYLRSHGRPNNFYRTDINVTFEDLPDRTNHVGVWQDPCTLCGDCFSGCNYRAKNTTLMNYLPDARNHGAKIFTGFQVRRLSRGNGKWLVHYRRANAKGKFQKREEALSADFVILAAGTLGSTEILLRSSQAGLAISGMAGDRFSGNGDALGLAYNCDEPIRGIGFGDREVNKERPVGPTITGVIDLRNTEPWKNGFIIEEGALPGAVSVALPLALKASAAALGVDTDSGILDELQEAGRVIESTLRGPYHGAVHNTQTFLVMAHEQTWGRMELKREEDSLQIKWKNAGKEAIFKTINKALEEATKALGGTYLINPLWSKLFNRELVTVHPLGGAIVAESAKDGVVNHKGQVFSGDSGEQVYETLYVADGSVVPTSLGVNPLLTISALAEREMALLAKDQNWTIDYSLPSRPR